MTPGDGCSGLVAGAVVAAGGVQDGDSAQGAGNGEDHGDNRADDELRLANAFTWAVVGSGSRGP
jgi:hypothetical protein